MNVGREGVIPPRSPRRLNTGPAQARASVYWTVIRYDRNRMGSSDIEAPMKSTPTSSSHAKLELVSFDLCPYVHRSTTLLHEKGVDFDLKYIDLKKKPDWFLEISPRGKVPVLLVDGTPVFESTAINDFVDEIEAPRFAPADPLARALEHGWIEVANDVFVGQYKILTAQTKEQLDAGVAATRDAFARFDKQLAGPFFAGDHFGLVDAAIAPALYRFVLLEKHSTLRIFDGFPKVTAWAHRLAERPSVVHGVKADFERRFLDFVRDNAPYLRQLLAVA